MRFMVLFFFLTFTQLSIGQTLDRNVLEGTQWKLMNEEAYPYSKQAVKLYDFSLSKDSVLSLVYCYIKYDYKVKVVTKDSLVLCPLFENNSNKNFVFTKAICTIENNPFNNSKYLSFETAAYQLIIEDSVGIQVTVIDRKYNVVSLTEKSQMELNNFILDNRFNDTYRRWIVIETDNRRFGVVSNEEDIIIHPDYKSIEFEKVEKSNDKGRFVNIKCTNFRGVVSNYTHYY